MLSTTALVEATTACELALVAIVALICGHIIKSVIYNLYWSPLSRFPGPKLAAASLIYEFYYDVVKGTFPWEIQRMHNIYGKLTPAYQRQWYSQLDSHPGAFRTYRPYQPL